MLRLGQVLSNQQSALLLWHEAPKNRNTRSQTSEWKGTKRKSAANSTVDFLSNGFLFPGHTK